MIVLLADLGNIKNVDDDRRLPKLAECRREDGSESTMRNDKKGEKKGKERERLLLAKLAETKDETHDRGIYVVRSFRAHIIVRVPCDPSASRRSFYVPIRSLAAWTSRACRTPIEDTSYNKRELRITRYYCRNN